MARWFFLTVSTLLGSPRPFGGTAASRLNCTGCSIAHICRCRSAQVKMSQTDSHPARQPSRAQRTFVRVLRALALEKRRRPTAPKILLQIWRCTYLQQTIRKRRGALHDNKILLYINLWYPDVTTATCLRDILYTYWKINLKNKSSETLLCSLVWPHIRFLAPH